MSCVRIAGILCLVTVAACAWVKEAPPEAAAQTRPLAAEPGVAAPNQDGPAAARPAQAEPIQENAALAALAAEPRQPAVTGNAAIANEPAAGTPAPPLRIEDAPKFAPPPATAPAKRSTAAAAIVQPRKQETLPPVAKPREPPLDVAALKARLRDTSAIGVFTKLALKNQVDDLLQQFRTHYLSGQKTDVAALRQPYDMLVLKVLALIQDSDPSLARTISGSREAIWGILADPQKFDSVS